MLNVGRRAGDSFSIQHSTFNILHSPSPTIALMPVTPRDEKSERSRRLVLDAALNLFSHQGYRATTMREIAERAGVSTGNCYHHFPDKETIFRTLIEEFWTVT